jgi:SIR2-like domain
MPSAMYNEAITGAPVTFFFGAGATRPLGKLLMGEFIEHLEANRGFRGRPLFREIVGKERDLEFLFEELDEWIGKGYYAPLSLFPRIESSELGIAGTDRTHEQFLDGFREVLRQAAEIRSELKREVFNTYREINNPQAVVDLFQPLFEAVSAFDGARPHPLVIFTTNYDPSIETFYERSSARYSLHDGFFHDESAMTYVWHRAEFDQFVPSAGKKHIVLFKLHGSTNWTKTKTRITKSPTSIYVEDDSAHENVLIYPAKRKVAIAEPFFTGYDYFQRCAERGQLCIVIGYSFRDYDALTKLMSASAQNSKLTVLLIDPNARRLCKHLQSLHIKAEAVPTNFGFGPGFGDYLLQVKAALATNVI